jgi:hypothetical protein
MDIRRRVALKARSEIDILRVVGAVRNSKLPRARAVSRALATRRPRTIPDSFSSRAPLNF